MKNTLFAAGFAVAVFPLGTSCVFAESDMQNVGGPSGSTIIEGDVGDDNHYILECGGKCQTLSVPGVIDPTYTGAWYDPAQSGHGLFVEVLPDNKIQAVWFTFNPAGTEQAWFLGVGTYTGNKATISAVQPTGGRWIPYFDPGLVVVNAWGTLTLTFTDSDHGKADFSSMLGYGSGSMNLTRLTRVAAGTASASIIEGGFVSTGNLNAARSRHTATLLRNGNVLVVGGCSDANCSVALDSVELYDPDSGTWSWTGRLSVARIDHTAIMLPDGKVLVAGGFGKGGLPIDSAELYDPVARTWTPTGNLTTARATHTATLLPTGKVLVLGGTGDYSRANNAELYDPSAGKWSPAAMPTFARKGHTATLLNNGKVLVAGGIGADYDPDFEFPAPISAEIYDPLADSWRTVGVPLVLAGHTATRLPDGKVLTAGGYHVHLGAAGGGYVDLRRVELYDPNVEVWSFAAPLSIERYGTTATLLPQGTVLMTGGDDVGGRSSAEVYDPSTSTWSKTGALNAGRSDHTATLLSDGNVLIVGGVNGVANPTFLTMNSAELYGASAPAFISPCLTGSWYDPVQSGHGLLIEILPDNQMLAAWFTFNPSGTAQSWIIGVGSYSGPTDTATLYSVLQPTGGQWIPNFVPSRVVNNGWGTLKFTFFGIDRGRVEFNSTLGYGKGSMNLTRLTQPEGLVCPFSPWDY